MFTLRPPAPPVPIVTSLVGILWSPDGGVSLLMIIAQVVQTGGKKTEVLTTNHPKTEILMV